MNPGKHQSSKQRGQGSGWKVHDCAHILIFTHTLCMNYVIAMFLLVRYMNKRNLPLYFARFCARSNPKIANKNLQQRTLPCFTTIYLNKLWSRSFISREHVIFLYSSPVEKTQNNDDKQH